MAKKKAIKSVWSRVSARLKRGALKARPLAGRSRQINPELPRRRTKNLHPLHYATLQRVLKAGSKSAKPFSKRMPRLVKKAKPYGVK